MLTSLTCIPLKSRKALTLSCVIITQSCVATFDVEIMSTCGTRFRDESCSGRTFAWSEGNRRQSQEPSTHALSNLERQPIQENKSKCCPDYRCLQSASLKVNLMQPYKPCLLQEFGQAANETLKRAIDRIKSGSKLPPALLLVIGIDLELEACPVCLLLKLTATVTLMALRFYK